MTAVVVIEAVVIVLLLVLVGGLLKSHAEILRQLHRLGESQEEDDPPIPPGTSLEKAPLGRIHGVDPSGVPRVIDLGTGGGNTVLAFLSSGCASCNTFWDQLGRDDELPVPDTRLVIVTRGPGSESPSRISERAPANVPVIMSDDAWDTFQVPMTPFFLLVDSNNRIVGEGSAAGWKQLRRLLRRSIADAPHPTRLDTSGRERFTDDRLEGSGVAPGDPSLHENPLDS